MRNRDGFCFTSGRTPIRRNWNHCQTSQHPESKDDEVVPASDLSDPSRTIVVVTTAALPWRTGTAVNPLLRALYLVRYQDERRREGAGADDDGDVGNGDDDNEEDHGDLDGNGDKGDDDDEDDNSDNNNNNNDKSEVKDNKSDDEDAAGGSVALAIPWLESFEDRLKLYGASNAFSDGPGGIREQEEWIKTYAAERCGMRAEAEKLRLIFYPAFYLAGFGSIFPKVDLCNFLPGEYVDVAVLEEPEHLNWFRVPEGKEGRVGEGGDGETGRRGGEEEEEEEVVLEGGDCGENGVFGQKVEMTVSEILDEGSSENVEGQPAVKVTPSMDGDEDDSGKEDEGEEDENVGDRAKDDHGTPPNPAPSAPLPPRTERVRKSKLGWTHRFRFVAGVVHTNYEAYARQFNVGASLIAAPAIGAFSALTIRAHCHQVIKLSDTLPSFAPGKEVTCNVHGVRGEFLEGVDLELLSPGNKLAEDNAEYAKTPSRVYFIGKLVWAKGFDLMLEVQEIFRKRRGEYFHIDVYGSGPDERAITRAFHGRNHKTPAMRPPSIVSKESTSPASSSHPADPKDLNAAAVFTDPLSVKDQSSVVIEQIRRESLASDVDDVVARYLSLGFEVTQMDGSATYVRESRKKLVGESDERLTAEESDKESSRNPLDILGDLSGKSFDTGVKTSQAVYNIADSSIKNILTMSFSQLKHNPLKPLRRKKEKDAGKNKEQEDSDAPEVADGKEGGDKPRFVFDPPASRYEWRRHPIPARFPGVMDHAKLKDMPHRIFLNPSTSEVLCTTTAEALAMNKFVIIPKHPSNEFFLQFTNCLSYDTLEECAEKMAWALENAPAKLSEEERRMFTWEAATERMIESSLVTVAQARERAESGMDRTDARIAYWLSESGEKGNMIRNLFHRNSGGDHSPSDG
ncbi:hypothetical protein ACHAWF_008914 [Thalassiosira exigua]